MSLHHLSNEAAQNLPEKSARPTRRAFVRTASQVAVTLPAVSIILAATSKPARAGIHPYCACGFHILDDFTFGNNEEDIDALSLQSNFNPYNHQANQDDVFLP